MGKKHKKPDDHTGFKIPQENQTYYVLAVVMHAHRFSVQHTFQVCSLSVSAANKVVKMTWAVFSDRPNAHVSYSVVPRFQQ